jgi:hypothetical protein
MNPADDCKIVYEFGGLQIHTAFALPGLVPSTPPFLLEHPADIQIRVAAGNPKPVGNQLHRWGGRYALALETLGGGDWRIRHDDDLAIDVSNSGRKLRCYCPDPARIPALAEILVRRVLPRLSALHGRLPIHAASLADGRGATLLFGGHNAGKSTMTAALALRLGWSILADDMSILSGGRRPTVWRGAPDVSLWPESQRQMMLPDADCHRVYGYDGKIRYAPACRSNAPNWPLQAIVFLSRGGDHPLELRRVVGPVALVMAASQLVRFNPRDRDESARLMADLKAVLEEVPAYMLPYPHGYDALPRVLSTLQRFRDADSRHPV